MSFESSITPELLEGYQSVIRTQNPLVASARTSIVRIKPHHDGQVSASGSGSVFDGGNYQWILTNKHVIGTAKDVLVFTFVTGNNQHIYTTTSTRHAKFSPTEDIAVLPMPHELQGLVPPLAWTENWTEAEQVFIIGYPQINRQISTVPSPIGPTILPGIARQSEENRMTVNHRIIGDQRGLSGGALVDNMGELIGVPYARTSINRIVAYPVKSVIQELKSLYR